VRSDDVGRDLWASATDRQATPNLAQVRPVIVVIWDDPGRDRPAGPDQRPKKDGRWLAGNARGQGVRHEEGRYLDCDIDHLAGASDLTGELGWGRPTQENRLPRIAKSSSADVGGRSRVVPSAVSRGMCDSQLAALALPESGPSDARFGSP